MVSGFESAKTALESRLRSRGVSLVRDAQPDRRSFGNAFADFEGRGIRLRLVQDRGQVFMQVTSPSELDERGETGLWYPVDGVLNFVGRTADGAVNETADFDEELDALEAAWEPFVRLFERWPFSKSDLDRYFKQRFDAAIRRST